MNYMKKIRKVIVFEGVDGAGKSTQARLLYFALKKRNVRVGLYHFPSEGVIGKFIRELLENKKFDNLDSKSKALLTAADFYSQYSENDNNSEVVIFDRYIYSSYVSNDTLDKEWIKTIHKYAPNPDFIFFIDGDPNSIKKRKNIDSEAKNEGRQKVFSQRYKKVFKDIPNITIDSEKDIDTIHQEILENITQKLNL